MGDVADRIQWILQEFKLTASEFAERVGIQASAVTHFLNRRNAPSYLVTCAILRAFPTLEAEWFMLGTGEARKASPSAPREAAAPPAQSPCTDVAAPAPPAPPPAANGTLFAEASQAPTPPKPTAGSAQEPLPATGTGPTASPIDNGRAPRAASPGPCSPVQDGKAPYAAGRIPSAPAPAYQLQGCAEQLPYTAPLAPPWEDAGAGPTGRPTPDLESPAAAHEGMTTRTISPSEAVHSTPLSPTPPRGRNITDVNSMAQPHAVRSEAAAYYAPGPVAQPPHPAARPVAPPAPQRVLLLYPDGSFEVFTPPSLNRHQD